MIHPGAAEETNAIEECLLCSNVDMEVLDVGHALFRHTDFTTVFPSGRIGRCTNCQMLSNLLSQDEKRRTEGWFRSTEYSQCNTMTHTLFPNGLQEPIPRTVLQAQVLRKLINKASPSILDVGCYDGDLLLELDHQFSSADLHGFDVNEHMGAVFPSASNFNFWTHDLKEVEGRFDVICISGTIGYISDVNAFMLQIKRLLKPDGLVFVQAVDISKSPYAILLGDQSFHYTPRILGNLFGNFGFELTLLESTWAPREIVGIARPGPAGTTEPFTEDTHIHTCLKQLDQLAKELRGMVLPASSKVGVLGTSAAAAFTHSILESNVAFFVDENPNRIGENFRSKAVIHPESLGDSHSVIIPYGDLSRGIKDRFDSQYKGRFICL